MRRPPAHGAGTGMPILFLDVFRAVWALRRRPGFATLGLLVVLGLAGATVFYWQVENLRPLDAAYLSVLTLTTVGYGDLTPATDGGKVFTAVYVLFGYGILLALVSMLADQLGRQGVLPAPLAQIVRRRHAAPAEANPDAAAPRPLPDYDVLVIGSGEAARRTAIEAARAGLRVVVLDETAAAGDDRWPAGDLPDARPGEAA
jgi:voltage-gated potassium channel